MKFKGTVTHLSQKGLGVVKNEENKLSYFVYGTWPGDIGEFEALDKILNNKKFAYAKLVQLIQPSPHRQQSACAYADWLSLDDCRLYKPIGTEKKPFRLCHEKSRFR